MALFKINDYDPHYRDTFEQDIVGFDLYSGDEKVGSVDNLLVDEQGKFRYLVINTGIWIFGKKVLLPIGQSRISFTDHRVYVDGLTHEQVENLPKFDEEQTVDYEHEEQVRGVYRPMASSRMANSEMASPGMASGMANARLENSADLDQSTSVERSASVEQTAPISAAPGMYDRTPDVATAAAYDRDTYSYDRDPHLYNLDDHNHQNLRLYEERLIANKDRHKTGEVRVGKHVETETARVSVPVESERVVIERVNHTNAGVVISPDAGDFHDGEVARIEVFEETPDIHKEAFVREEVRVSKQVDRRTVEAEETLRKERLDISSDGNPVIDGQGFDDDRRI